MTDGGTQHATLADISRHPLTVGLVFLLAYGVLDVLRGGWDASETLAARLKEATSGLATTEMMNAKVELLRAEARTSGAELSRQVEALRAEFFKLRMEGK